MIRSMVKFRRRRILVDVDTQRDFLLAQGTACVRNHRRVLANIRRVAAWARQNHIHTISTVEVHSADNGKVSYCLDGSDGQKKISYTLRANRRTFIADGSTDLPRDILRVYDQVIFNKRCADPFDEPRLDRLFSELRADEFILIGTSLEGAIKATALGLLQRGKNVSIITDAIGSHNKTAADLALRQMQAKGAKLIETRSLAGASKLRLVGACHCDRCQRLAGKQTAYTATGN